MDKPTFVIDNFTDATPAPEWFKSPEGPVNGQTKTVAFTVNGQIAVEPFQATTTLKTVKRGGLRVLDQTISLIKTKAVFDYKDSDLEVCRGGSIYLKGNVGFQAWAKQVYEYEGIKFVLVPKTEIVMVNNNG